MTVHDKKVAAGINYLRAMRESNLNVYELSEDLEIDVNKTLQLNYDTKKVSEFVVMLPVKVTVTRM